MPYRRIYYENIFGSISNLSKRKRTAIWLLIKVDQMGSLLGMLYCCYSQSNQMETKRMQQQFETLDGILRKLPIKEHDQVIDVTIGLCTEQQRKAFLDGIMIGFRLYSELYQTEKTPSAVADGVIEEVMEQ